MKKRSIVFKTLFIISCAFGLSLTVASSSSFAIYISYYTTQSNILCLVVMIMTLTWILFGKGEKPRVLRLLKSLATVCILVTFLIFHFLLRPNMEPDMDNVAHGLGNIMVHYVTPIWFFADYLLYDVKGTTRVADPLWYALFPLYYFVFANVRAVTGELYQYGTTITQFPYPFLDYEVLGIFGVSAAVLVITIAVLVLGIVFVGFDRVMKKPQERYRTHQYGAISHRPIERPAERAVISPQPSHAAAEIKKAEESPESLLPPS